MGRSFRLLVATVFIVHAGVPATNAHAATAEKEVPLVREYLGRLGYDVGADEPRRELVLLRAIRQYQFDWMLPETGLITGDLIERLIGDHPATRPQWRMLQGRDCSAWSGFPQPREIAIWSGDCVDGKASGAGTMIWRYFQQGRWLEDRYEGSYKDGRPHGSGEYFWADGQRYSGGFRNGLFHGWGVKTWSDGESCAGEFRNGLVHGRGVYVWVSGIRYEGSFRNGVAEGRGAKIWPDGDRYEGDFRDNTPNGFGIYAWANGSRYIGEIRNNMPDGFGSYFDKLKHETIRGRWRDGCLKVDGQPYAINRARAACGK